MLTERAFDAGAVSLNYAEGPSAGPPLVLLHGGSASWQTFLPVLPLLGWRWHVYAPDFRGHGRSGHAVGAYRIADYAQDTARFLREVVREPAVVLGHSLGGVVAVQVATEMPDAVRAIVLEDPGLAGAPLAGMAGGAISAYFIKLRELLRSGQSRDEVIAALDQPRSGMNAVALRSRATSLLQLDPDMLTRFIDDSIWEGYDRDALLARIRCPALLLQADPAAGGVLADALAEHVASSLADCALVRWPGVGHLIHNMQPLAFTQLVTDFLESLRAEAALAP